MFPRSIPAIIMIGSLSLAVIFFVINMISIENVSQVTSAVSTTASNVGETMSSVLSAIGRGILYVLQVIGMILGGIFLLWLNSLKDSGSSSSSSSSSSNNSSSRIDYNDIQIERKMGQSSMTYWISAGGGYGPSDVMNQRILTDAAKRSPHGQSRAKNRKTGQIMEYGWA
jgi:hypothetical protein